MWLKLVLGLVAAALASAAVMLVAGSRMWSRAVQELDDAVTGEPRSDDLMPLEHLPEPVRRYVARAVPQGRPLIAVARLTQEGHFQMGEGTDGWRPFTATEVMRSVEPAFYWDAAIQMAPFVRVRVLDSYMAGSAGMLGKILGVLTVVSATDGPELRQGALSRYLAEAVWIPTRLASGPGLEWTEIDERSAQVTLRDRGTSVTLRFTFDEEGDPVEVYGIRGREDGGAYVDTPWIGRFRDHRETGGYRIPVYGEVAWVIEGVERPYWRGTITSADFVGH